MFTLQSHQNSSYQKPIYTNTNTNARRKAAYLPMPSSEPCFANISEKNEKNEKLADDIDKMAWLGKTRQECLDWCRLHRLDSVSFAHWLAIPSCGLLLTLKHQQCVEVDCIAVDSL